MVDVIFLLIVVAVIISRLYSVFGTRGNEKGLHVVLKRVNKEEEKNIIENIKQAINENENVTVDISTLSEQDKILTSIPDFNKDAFLNGAKRVFEMVLQAFNKGELSLVRNLINKKIFDKFNEVLANRKENNITTEIDFICFDKSEIKDVKLLKSSVKIAVEFVSEQVNLIKDAQGNVVEGDENFVQKITDMWTFERMLNAKNNNWVLVSTKKSL